MNENTADEIIKVLDKIGQQFGIAVDWGNSNIIHYIQSIGDEIIKYSIASDITWMCILRLLMIISFLFFLKGRKYPYDDDKHKEIDCEDACTWIGIICGAIAFISFCVNLFYLIKCYTFQDQVIFDYVKSIISSGNKQ